MRNLAMAAVVVAGIGLTGCEDKAKPAAATVTDKAPSALAEAPKAANPGEAKVYAFGPENSKIGFKGAKITGSHLGGFNQFKGEIHASENLADASKVNVEIDLASVFTDAEKLTGHLKSPDFFDVEKFPKATFTSTSVKPVDGEANKYTVTGDLDLHGVTKQISFPAMIVTEGEMVKATSEFSINRKEFGIVYPGMPDDLIRDDVIITLAVSAPKSAQQAAAGEAAN